MASAANNNTHILGLVRLGPSSWERSVLEKKGKMIQVNLTSVRRLLTIAAVLAVVLSSGALMEAAPVLYCKSGPGIDLTTAGCISGTAKGYPHGGDGIYSNAGGGDDETRSKWRFLAHRPLR